jgi:hypothetical protein
MFSVHLLPVLSYGTSDATDRIPGTCQPSVLRVISFKNKYFTEIGRYRTYVLTGIIRYQPTKR